MSYRRTTIADVAREAGVSQQTVSRAINDKGEISPRTRTRVLEVVDRLGYRPSSLARGLVTRRTLTIGVVVPDIANAFFSEIVRGAEGAAQAAGYSLLLASSAEEKARESAVIRTLEEKQVDGIILCSPRLSDEELLACMPVSPPLVLINRRIPSSTACSVLNNDYAGARLAIRHLLSTGRRNIGFLSGPSGSFTGRQRAKGYHDELSETGLIVDPTLNVLCLPYWEEGQVAARGLLMARPQIDALYCFNDLVAAGALLACGELGRRVPEDVAIVGSDDIFLARLMTPPLTTLRAKKQQLGAVAVELLLDQIKGSRTRPETVILEPELIIRGSAPGPKES